MVRLRIGKVIGSIFVFILGFASLSAVGAKYYVSTLGNDLNSGTSEDLAWKSLAKVNSFTPRPGDEILFRCGDEWAGTLVIRSSGTSGSPITYSSYGTGAKPKIYGSEKITGWTQHSGNIYKATVTTPVTQLFLDGSRMKLGRYPNSGYMKISSVVSQTQITCTTLPAGIDFVGSKFTVKTNDWRLDTRSVIASTSNYLIIDSPASYALVADRQFFLSNKLQFVDSPGEWYYDSATKTVYLWTRTGDSPANHIVRGSVYLNGVSSSLSNYIVVRGLDISQQTEDGIDINGSNNIIDGNNILGAETFGINCEGANVAITNNKIAEINHMGISMSGNYCNISGNELINTALFDNLGLNGMQGYSQVIAVSGDANQIKYNRIVNAAYNGITWSGINNLLEFNFIENVCSVLIDGGAIYTCSKDINSPGSSGSVVRGNIVLNCPKLTYAIYMDVNTRDVLIEKNTVANCKNVGIYIHYAKNIVVQNNTLFDITRGMRAKGTYGGNKFNNNILCNIATTTDWYNDIPISPTLVIILSTENTIALDNNTYIDHHRKAPFKNTITSSYLTFEQWKTSTGQDVNSKFDGSTLATGEKEELFINDTKATKTINLGTAVYRDIAGKQVFGSFVLEPFMSKILVKTTAVIVIDNTPPVISKFSVPSTSNSLTVTISSFTATDDNAVTGYKVTETSTVPGAGDSGWTPTAPTSYIFSSPGSKTLYAWAKDAAGNVSASYPAMTSIDIAPPVVAAFSVPSSSTSLTIPVNSFTASDNVAVTGYKINEISTVPGIGDSGWTASPPTSYTFSTYGSKTLYAWAKDAAGNVSVAYPANTSIVTITNNTGQTFSEYLFEESTGSTVIDSKSSNNGIIINNATRVSGITGQCLELSGSGYIDLGNVFGDNVQNELTLSAWIKPTSSTDSWQGLITHEGANYNTFTLYINPLYKKIGFKTTGTSPIWNQWTEVGNTTLWDGSWHHISVTYNGSVKTIFLDGIAVKTVNSTGAIEPGQGYKLVIGAASKELPSTSLYKGQLDEVRIFNYALTSDKIQSLMTTSNNSEYLFEETSGLTVIDSKGLNNGTIVNSLSRVAGVKGNGIEFNGSGYIDLGQAFGTNVQSELTLSCWIKPTLSSDGWQGVITHEGLNYNTFTLYINPQYKKIGFKTTGTAPSWYQWFEVAGVNSIWDGNWHNLTVTFNGSQKVIYVDGIIIKTVVSTGQIESGLGYKLFLGAASKELPSTSLYKGVMDEVRIYNSALNSTQVLDLFNLSNPLALKVATISEPGLANQSNVQSKSDNFSTNTSFFDTDNFGKENDFVLYPNPASSYVNVRYKNLPLESTRIRLIDIAGRTVLERNVENTTEVIEIGQLSKGLYHLSSISAMGSITRELLIVK